MSLSFFASGSQNSTFVSNAATALAAIPNAGTVTTDLIPELNGVVFKTSGEFEAISGSGGVIATLVTYGYVIQFWFRSA